MRTKFLQFALATVVGIALSAQSAVAKGNSPAHLGRDHVAPVTALQEAVGLLPASQSLVSDIEMDMFKRVASGDSKNIKEIDAILTAANITDDASRQRYAKKLDNITAGARAVIADAKTPEEKADKLAKFLFGGPCHGGFEDNQVDMRKLLDQGKFNCVSSCVLYNLVGSRVGLKTRAVTIPGHVFLRMGDLYIEPVGGFTNTAEVHDKNVVDKSWAEATAVWKTVFGDTRSYQSGNMGLIGEIYLDNGGKFLAQKQYEEAAINVLKAACLDPKHPVFAFQAENTIRNWFNDTLNQKNFAKAQKIAAIYGQLFGDDSNKLFAQLAAARNQKLVAKS